jgi:hypothetical protein
LVFVPEFRHGSAQFPQLAQLRGICRNLGDYVSALGGSSLSQASDKRVARRKMAVQSGSMYTHTGCHDSHGGVGFTSEDVDGTSQHTLFDPTSIRPARRCFAHHDYRRKPGQGTGKYDGNTIGGAVRIAEKMFHGKK